MKAETRVKERISQLRKRKVPFGRVQVRVYEKMPDQSMMAYGGPTADGMWLVISKQMTDNANDAELDGLLAHECFGHSRHFITSTIPQLDRFQSRMRKEASIEKQGHYSEFIKAMEHVCDFNAIRAGYDNQLYAYRILRSQIIGDSKRTPHYLSPEDIIFWQSQPNLSNALKLESSILYESHLKPYASHRWFA